MKGKGNQYGVKCPKCQSQSVWKQGFVPTIGGRKDRFKCTMCAHTFHGKAVVAINGSIAVAIVIPAKHQDKALTQLGRAEAAAFPSGWGALATLWTDKRRTKSAFEKDV